MCNRIHIAASLLVYLVGLSSHLMAGLPAIAISGPGRVSDRDWVVGYQFTAHREITITDLGKFDGNGNGILDDVNPPQVGVWDIIGQRLASATIDQTSTFENGTFYSPISPVTLSPGNYVIGVQAFQDQEPFLAGTKLSTSSALTWDEGRRSNSSDFRFPVRGTSGRASYMGPSFKIDEPIVLSEPTARAVFQRDERNFGHVRLQGALSDQVDRVEARALVMDGFSGTSTGWQPVDTAPGRLNGTLNVPAGGWYRIEARAFRGEELLGQDVTDQIGVGEVFITAGQSNSANHGSPRLTPQSDLVSAMDDQTAWQHARDPQPIATGSSGSPWPALGDLLVQQLDVPVGFVSVGWGGTTVGQWLPEASGPDSRPLYERLRNAIHALEPHGARAILWHQGESDASSSTSTQRYAERLEQVIAQSREDAGRAIPWLVARVSFLPSTSTRSESRIVAGQEQVIQNDPLVFAGPLTDDLIGSQWRWDQIHFNEAGLRQHAARWADAINTTVLIPEPPSILSALAAIVVACCGFRRGGGLRSIEFRGNRFSLSILQRPEA